MSDEEREMWVEQRSETIKARLRAAPAKSVLAEFEALAVMLVIECADVGATEWPAGLHLADVLEKHLVRMLHGRIK